MKKKFVFNGCTIEATEKVIKACETIEKTGKCICVDCANCPGYKNYNGADCAENGWRSNGYNVYWDIGDLTMKENARKFLKLHKG